MRINSFLALLVSVAGCAHAQPVDSSSAANSPRFEAATIKPGRPPSRAELVAKPELDGCAGGPSTADPEHLKCNARLASLLVAAYHLESNQFAPEIWMQTSWWSIEAKVPAGATVEQVSAMVRNLLAERFKLAVHFVQKEVPAYEMTVAKGGPKFNTGNHERPPGTKVMSAGVPVSGPIYIYQLAYALSEEAGLPVVNKTGLTGRYEVNFHVGVPAPPGSLPPGTTGFIRLPLAEAVRDQLGLSLEWTKSTVDVMVVDHIRFAPARGGVLADLASLGAKKPISRQEWDEKVGLRGMR